MRQNLAPQHVGFSLGQPADSDALDRELVRWFRVHGCAWSGTSGELLRTLKTEASLSSEILPASSEVLYAHIAAHRQLLRCSGIEVTLGQGYPRIVSLRWYPKQEAEQSSPITQDTSDQARRTQPAFESNVVDSSSPRNAHSEQPVAERVAGMLLAISDVQEQIRKRVQESSIKPVRSNDLSNADTSHRSSSVDDSASNRGAEQNPPHSTESQSHSHEQGARVQFAPEHESETPVTSMSDVLRTIRDFQQQIRSQTNVSHNQTLVASQNLTLPKNVARPNFATDLSKPPAKAITMDKGSASEAHSGDRVPNTSEILDNNGERPVFDNVAEALSKLIDMQKQIEARYVDPGPLVQFVAEQMQQITKSTGVAIAVFRNGNIVDRAETGVMSQDPELQCHSKLFEDLVAKGKTLEVRDAQSDSRVGAICLRLGVKSLIGFPFHISRDSVGGIQLAYQETCRLQSADKVTLKLIVEAVAAAINDRQSGRSVPVTRPREAGMSASTEAADAELGQLSSNTGETLGKWKSMLKRRRMHQKHEPFEGDKHSA